MANVLISSLGLMGSSLAAALSQQGWTVYLHHRRDEISASAQRLGFGIQVIDPRDVANTCELAVVCTPVSAVAEWVRRFAKDLPNAVITDVGSVKGPICRELLDLARTGGFVGSHPMAGSHLQGLAHADPTLYQQRVTVLTPTPGTPEQATARVENMWKTVGSRVLRMDPDEHDHAVAQASHLSHVLACVAASGLGDKALPLASTGFRDTTRVASGSPELWTDILFQNRHAVLTELASARVSIDAIITALKQEDAPAINRWLSEAKERRAKFTIAQFGQSPSRENGE